MAPRDKSWTQKTKRATLQGDPGGILLTSLKNQQDPTNRSPNYLQNTATTSLIYWQTCARCTRAKKHNTLLQHKPKKNIGAMQVLRPNQIRAWTKVKNLMGKLKWEILRQFETIFSNGNKLVNLSNTSLEPASKADMGGHAAPGENSHINQKPPSCFWILMIKSQQHQSTLEHKCRATLESSRHS